MPTNGNERSTETPISSRRRTPSGMRPSPQGLSMGHVPRSRTVTGIPARAAKMDVASPAGPPPTTMSWCDAVTLTRASVALCPSVGSEVLYRPRMGDRR